MCLYTKQVLENSPERSKSRFFSGWKRLSEFSHFFFLILFLKKEKKIIAFVIRDKSLFYN